MLLKKLQLDNTELSKMVCMYRYCILCTLNFFFASGSIWKSNFIVCEITILLYVQLERAALEEDKERKDPN